MKTYFYLPKELPLPRNVCASGFGLGVGLCFFCTSCLALQTYPLVDQQKTEVMISQTEQNRIAVLGDRIQQVFGANGIFDVESDEDGGQIFLIATKSRFAPQTSSPLKPTTITIITEEGLTQDLKLIPKDMETQSVLFKPTLSLGEENIPQEKAFQKGHLSQVITLLKAMAKDEELTGYTKTVLDKEHPLTASSRFKDLKSLKLKIKEVACYTSSHYEGRIYRITNQGEKPIPLKESDFALPHDSALSISRPMIHPGETISLYVVTRECLTQECSRRSL